MEKNRKKVLGTGIDAFFKEKTEIVDGDSKTGVLEVKIEDVIPGEGQPRKVFDSDKIEDLASSIKKHGIIQPLIVHKEGNTYRIIAGERRWRAAKKAGLKVIPIIEKEVTDREVLELALIENIQREDLNPIEEAEAYERLKTEYSLTQDALAEIMSKGRADIANSLRLLSLNKKVQKMIASGELTKGHGKALLGLKNAVDTEKVAQSVVKGNLNVRQTEALVKRINEQKQNNGKKGDAGKTSVHALAVKEVEAKLREKLGAKVTLTDNNGKGRLQIEYSSADERERIIDRLLG